MDLSKNYSGQKRQRLHTDIGNKVLSSPAAGYIYSVNSSPVVLVPLLVEIS